jgi:hypothetical protein
MRLAAIWAPLAAALLCADVRVIAQPTIVPDRAVMNLDELGLYAVGYAYRGAGDVRFPDGWSGPFDDQTGIALEPAGVQNGKAAMLLHCPWRGGTGIAFQQFRIAFPRSPRIALTGFIAMRAEGTEQSDGVTFRIRADGRTVFEEHRKSTDWSAFRVDLTSLAGRTVVLRFETDPGPSNNPSFDFSLWAERSLRIEGFVAPKPARAKPAGVPPWPAGNAIRAGAWYAAQTGVNDRQWRWEPPARGSDPPLGRLTLRVRGRDGTWREVPAAQDSRIVWTGQARFVGAVPLRAGSERRSARAAAIFNVDGQKVTLTLEGRLERGAFALRVRADRPLIQRLEAGGFGPVLRRQPVSTPYCPVQVLFLSMEQIFVSRYLDWTASNASSHDGARAMYGHLTDGSRSPLEERVLYCAGPRLEHALPHIPNPPSPYRAGIAKRIVLDIWGGSYVGIAKDLERLKEAGIDHCIALIHVWQRSGYDNALPMHLPANADLGGDEGMKGLVETARRLGYLIALHENYVDYYPNYDHFDESHIALDSEGRRQLAWYNAGTRMQSFAVKPTAILPLARLQSPEIHRRFGTNACYLDVHSAVPPWFHVDFRAGEPGAGRFSAVWRAHKELFAYERRVHGGPVFGEGNNHAYWSGLLDGVEAQFGTGWPQNRGLDAPLAVDFNLLRIHPLQLNHGMGYYERWWDGYGWGTVPPMEVFDQYRAQEIAYGHAGFLGAATWNILPLAWLEHHLVSPVQERHATQAVRSIAYQVGGRWVDGSEAAIKSAHDRVRIVYANGLTITVNNAREPLGVDGHRLPRHGWLAKGAGLTAWTAMREGVMADYAATPSSFFANARHADHWNIQGVRRIRPTVAEFIPVGPRRFRITYRWQVSEAPDRDFQIFVHFSQPTTAAYDEGIRFQNDHASPRPTSSWRAGEVVVDGPHEVAVPADAADGDYECTIGLHSGGARASLLGPKDRNGRVRLGTLQVREEGRSLRFVPVAEGPDPQDAALHRNLNTQRKVIDFGPLRTNGSVLVRREGGDWVLRAMPRDRAFEVWLRAAEFGAPSRVRAEGGSDSEVRPERQGGFWRLPLNGAARYRWPAAQAGVRPSRSR